MELQCDICFLQFDLDCHRPKSLPCGHTICKECVQNPAMGKKCPTCRKELEGDHAVLPDNILAIRLIENGTSPCKIPRRDNIKLKQLQQGVDAGRRLVQLLRKLVPVAVEALNRQLASSVTQLREMEEALERRAAADVCNTTPELEVKELQLVEQLEDSLSLLTSTKCNVMAEEGRAAWRASVQLGPDSYILHLLLLQLRTDGQLEKVANPTAPVSPTTFVGPPMLSILSIVNEDLDDGQLKVTDILRNGRRWKNVRILRNVKGGGSDKLLRVVAPHLEEVEILGGAELKVMEEVEKMSSLKRLKVECREDLNGNYPDLPLQLKELWMRFPKENQIRCVESMARLRSLLIYDYHGPNVTFLPSQHGRLLWLGVGLNTDHKATMLSLIRAHALSLQELHIYCAVSNEGDLQLFYFPDLGQDLAASGLHALRRLVFRRSTLDPCTEVDACLLQLRSVRGCLPSSVDVVCEACHVRYLCSRVTRP
ncbi:uncharacterized protein LOC113214791 [Frankliniella occidentalis]|uniref:Uncharacterized protein LOC113214791 n=1 Tax=Frankliniella occidentalis TaxID=133901 RepID=A0A6J1TB64_FRAOC|nr:uncharacterized protein LOC113214791 [Frankliniella occidentalis]